MKPIKHFPIILPFLIAVLAGAGFYLFKNKEKQREDIRPVATESQTDKNSEPEALPSKVLLDVPFTSQAPFGNWEDVGEQNGCEEASILMAVYWARGEMLTPETAQEEIKKISDYHLKNYGHFHDLSNADTLKLLNEYFNYSKARLAENITAEDIKRELSGGRVVIVPVNGVKLGNPYYAPPGPVNHKIVIIGYDDATGEFITHDSGTSRGEKFRYDYKTLEDSLEDYPTGLHGKFEEKITSMIVVEK